MPQALLNQAIKELKHLHPGEKFLVKDLFKGYEWNRIDIGDRRTLGTLFLNYVNSTSSAKVSVLGKTSSNQQEYQKQ